VSDRDVADTVRFAPIQSDFGIRCCQEYDMPTDLSTAFLLDHERRPHCNSAAILRMLLYLKRPYSWLGRLGLLVPQSVRDWGYKIFARNRGAIWKVVKKMTGMGDTAMHPHKHKILGISNNVLLPPSWGFLNDGHSDNNKEKNL